MAVKTTLLFETEKVWNFTQKGVKKNLEHAMEYMLDYCISLIDTEGNKIPSQPGVSPHKQSGQLIDSLDTDVVTFRGGCRGVFTTDSPYALRLEYGFVGTDAKGRRVNQAPRPFLRKTLWDTAPLMEGMIGKKLF